MVILIIWKFSLCCGLYDHSENRINNNDHVNY